MRQRKSSGRVGGFALIEQIAAVLAIGTASAVALPQLAALQTQAQGVALRHLASAVGTAMLMNQGGCLVSGQHIAPDRCRPVRDCADAGSLLHGDLPDGYRAEPQPIGRGAEAVCRLLHLDSGDWVTFTGVGTSN